MLFFSLTAALAADQPAPSAPDENLLAAIAAGSETALATLYEQTNSAVYGFALSILKNRQDAEDVMQETYVHLARAAASYRPEGKPMAWILTIAKNIARTRLRENGRLCYPETEPAALSLREEISDDRLVLAIALQKLEDEERQIVMLHAVSGLKHREIAALLERPLSTVLSRYHRALSKTRRELLAGGGFAADGKPLDCLRRAGQ